MMGTFYHILPCSDYGSDDGSWYRELDIPSQLESGMWKTTVKIVWLRFRNQH